jgi:hypothetical protein
LDGEGSARSWRGLGPWRGEVRSFVELFALCGIAVAQPAFDLLTKNAELFVTLQTTAIEAIVLTVLILVVPPLALYAIEVVLTILVPPGRRFVHAGLAALVVAVVASELIKHQTDLRARVIVLVAVVAGVAAGLLLLRFTAVGLWLRYLAIAPPLFAVLFLLSGSVDEAVFASGPSAAGADIQRPRRVVVIVLDELPLMSLLDGAGRIDATLFPNIAALADDATWYRNGTTVAQDTQHAVPAIVSGNLPSDPTALPVATTYPKSLFTLLGGTYSMNVHETVTKLCPRSVCDTSTGAAGRHGLGSLVHDSATLWGDFAKPSREATVSLNVSETEGNPLPSGTAFVRSLEPSATPRLDYLHVELPHQPWHIRPGFRDDGRTERDPGLVFIEWINQATADAGRLRHLLQVQAADELVGRIVAKLRGIGAYRDSLIVLTADHGIAFTGGAPERGLARENWAQPLWVPMLVKRAHQEQGRVDDRPAFTIDLLPTIADQLGVDMDWEVDGRSLDGPPRANETRRVFEWTDSKLQPPPGKHLITLDGRAGFAQVLRASTPPAGGDPALRLYRLGPFGPLVGQPVDRLIDRGATPTDGTIDDPERFAGVDAGGSDIDWTFVDGTVRADATRPLVVAVNGVVAGVATSLPTAPGSPDSQFWATLAPELFRDGRNDVALFLVTGTPLDPHLVPVRLER